MRILTLILLFILNVPAVSQFAGRTQFFSAQAPAVAYDSDAAAWIAAVETADAAGLETGVKNAMNQLVLDLKSNSLWTEITSMTVMMGARTIAGAMINIKTPAGSWTSNSFVSGDYNRTTGLLGDGSTKYISTGINNNSLSQDDRAMWAFVTTLASGTNDHYIGGGRTAAADSTAVRRANATDTASLCSNASATSDTGANAVGFIGISRDNSANYISRGGQANSTITATSTTPLNVETYFFAGNDSGATLHADARICAGFVGTSHNMATAETVMNTYIASITSLGL